MSSLQLLAAHMKIDGPVTNTHPSVSADIGLTAGNAELVLDPSAPEGGARRPLVREKRLVGGNVHEAVIDVAPRGLLSASRVTLAVSGDIRLLGESPDRLAVVFGTDGDVMLQAGGALIARSARVRSSHHVQINAETGRLTIRSPAPVRVEGGETTGGAGTVIPGGVQDNPAIASHGASSRRPGLFRDLLLQDLLP